MVLLNVLLLLIIRILCKIGGTSDLLTVSAQIKCDRRLALVYCFTLALAQKMQYPAVFAALDKELQQTHIDLPLTVRNLFLDGQEITDV